MIIHYCYDYTKIKKIRENERMTQKQCASIAHVTIQQWQKWENGTNCPSAESLGNIAKCFNESVQAFYVSPATIRTRDLLNNFEMDMEGKIQ